MAIKRSFILSSGLGVSADNIFVVNNTNSVSSTTGSIISTGGVGIGQSASISGRLQMFNGANYTAFQSSASGNTVYTLPSTSPATGSSVLQSDSAGILSWVPMTATGGGVAGTVYDGSLNSIPYYPTAGTAITGSLSFTNTGTSINIGYTTAATNSSSGALTIVGGVGIGDSLFVAGNISFNTGTNGLLFRKLVSGNYGAIYSTNVTPSATNYTMITDGANVNFNGTSGVYFNISNTNKIQVTTNNINIVPIAASTSTSTGAFTVAGGVGIGGSLYVASATAISGITINNGIITGNLTGTATTAQNLNTVSALTNSAHLILFSPSNSGSGVAVSSNSAISYNPSTLVLSTSGLAITAGTASTNSSTGALIVTGGVGIGGSLYVAGDLTINGTTTTINTVTLTVDDKNIELGSVATPSDVTAEGGGITLRGATDKSINWYTGTGWSSSESCNLASGNTYKINNTAVISNSSLGTGVTNSSLTALGTITTGVWSGTSITAFYGGTGLQTTFTVGDILYANTSSTWARLTANSNSGYVLTSAGSGATPTYVAQSTLFVGNATSSGIATTATNINVISASTNANHPLLFTPSFGSASGLAVSSNTTLVYNPSSDILSVSGAAITSATASNTASTGSLVVTGGVGIGQSVSVGGRLQLFNSSNYTAFVSSATGNTVYTLPATSPATGSSILQSTSAGVLSWVSSSSLGNSSGGTVDGTIQYKSGSGFAGTNSLFFDTALLGLRISGFPGGNIPASTDAVLKLESTIGSFNGSLNGTYIAVNAPTGFAGDLMNLQVNAVSKFRIDNTGAIIQNIGTNSTSTTSGAVQIKGGVGITGALFAGESINATSTTVSTSTSTGSLVVSGGAGFAGTINVGGTAKVFASTASTNTWTGALLVGGGVGISGQLTFAQASLGYTGITTNPSMSFIGNTSSSPITLTVLTDNSLNFEGSQGSVFSIDSNLSSGEIFSVSDISGLPIISASAGQTVTFNEFGGYTQFGNGTLNSSSTSTGSVVIAGGLGMTGNANIGGTARFTNTTASTSSTTGALTVSGGAGIAQTLFVGGSISNANYFYSGGNNFAKSGQAQGDILLDNNANDTPGVLYYYKNNTNFGTDVFATGTGSTRFRIVKDLNESGGSELWSIDRTGVVSRSAWDVGEVINTRVYNNSDLGMSATTTINSTTYTNVATITYTPKSSTSHLWIEFDANYDYSSGTTTDDFFSRITVAGSVISERNQIMVGQVGGGTRSGVIFPISGRYTNSSTSGIAITVQARWGSADDAIRVYGSSTSGYMRIQEIGR